MPIPSDAPERSPSFERSGTPAASKTRQRRSTPATPASPSFTEEIARLTARRETIAAELENLSEEGKAGWMYQRERAALASKLRNVDKKIFAYRQFVFLFGDPI